MIDHFHRRIKAIEDRISQPILPTFPQYGLNSTLLPPPPPPDPITLCGGIEAGPAAIGVGGGTGTGTALVLTLSRNIPCDGFLVIVTGAFIQASTVAPGFPSITSISDPHGGGWVVTGGSPSIGPRGTNFGTSPSLKSSLITTRVKAVSSGDYVSGDTVTVNWAGSVGTLYAVGMIFAVTNAQFLAEKQGGLFVYGNSDDYPNDSASSTTLNWLADEGFNPEPDNPAALISAYLSVPGGGTFTPNSGVLVGSVTSTQLDVFFTLATIVGGPVEPGAVWGTSHQALASNYQFVKRL